MASHHVEPDPPRRPLRVRMRAGDSVVHPGDSTYEEAYRRAVGAYYTQGISVRYADDEEAGETGE